MDDFSGVSNDQLADQIVTWLARSDPAAADSLSDVYASFRKIVSG